MAVSSKPRRRTAAAPPLPLTQRSATQLASAIRASETSAREVVEAHVALLRKVNPTLNAVVADRYEAALAEADAADARVAAVEDPATLPPLLGVPCTIKESIALAGMPNCRRPGRARRRARDRERARRAAPRRRRRDPARRHEHVRAVHVDRVGQPPLRPHEQRVRPHPHRRRLLRRRGRGRRQRRLAVRARLRRRRLDPRPRLLQRRLRPQAVARARADDRRPIRRAAARCCGWSPTARSRGAPRT